MGFMEMHLPNGQTIHFGEETAQSSMQHCDACDRFKGIEGGRTVQIYGEDLGQTGETVAWFCRDCANGR